MARTPKRANGRELSCVATLSAIRLNVSGKIFGSGPTWMIVSMPEASVLSTTSQTQLRLIDPAMSISRLLKSL